MLRKFDKEFSIKISLKIGEMDVSSNTPDGVIYLLKKYRNSRGVMITVHQEESSLYDVKYSITAPDAILYNIIRKWSELKNVNIIIGGDD